MVKKADNNENNLYVKNPHDKLVKFMLSRGNNFQILLEKNLSKELLNLLDIQTIKIIKETFIDSLLSETKGDIVAECSYKSKISGKNKKALLLFLFEHKSYNDFMVLLQNLNYMISIWKLKLDGIAWNNKPDEFEIIVPIVFYHGKEPWKVPLEFNALFNTENEELLKYIPNYKYEFIQVTKEQFELYSSYKDLLLLTKALYYNSQNQMEFNYRELLYLCRDEFNIHGYEVFNSITMYVLNTSDVAVDDYIEATKNILFSSENEETAMSTAERLYKQGYDEAKKEIDLKINMLHEVAEKARKEAEKARKEAERAKREAEKETEIKILEAEKRTEKEMRMMRAQIAKMVSIKFPEEYDFLSKTLEYFNSLEELLELLQLIFSINDVTSLNLEIIKMLQNKDMKE